MATPSPPVTTCSYDPTMYSMSSSNHRDWGQQSFETRPFHSHVSRAWSISIAQLFLLLRSWATTPHGYNRNCWPWKGPMTLDWPKILRHCHIFPNKKDIVFGLFGFKFPTRAKLKNSQQNQKKNIVKEYKQLFPSPTKEKQKKLQAGNQKWHHEYPQLCPFLSYWHGIIWLTWMLVTLAY